MNGSVHRGPLKRSPCFLDSETTTACWSHVTQINTESIHGSFYDAARRQRKGGGTRGPSEHKLQPDDTGNIRAAYARRAARAPSGINIGLYKRNIRKSIIYLYDAPDMKNHPGAPCFLKVSPVSRSLPVTCTASGIASIVAAWFAAPLAPCTCMSRRATQCHSAHHRSKVRAGLQPIYNPSNAHL